MKRKTTELGTTLMACLALLISAPAFAPLAHAQTYYLNSNPGEPFPYDPYAGAEPVVVLDYARQIYQVQDNTNAYAMIVAAHQLDAMSAMSADSIDPTGGDGSGTNSGGGDFSPGYQPLIFGPDDLVIQILQIDTTNQLAFLQLTNTVPGDYYQLLSTNLLSTNGQTWTLGQFTAGAAGTNITPFDAFSIGTNSQMLFRAHHANPVLYVTPGVNAIEPDPVTSDPGQTGHLSYPVIILWVMTSRYFTRFPESPVTELITAIFLAR